MTVWVLVTVWFYGAGSGAVMTEDFQTKQQCEYEKLAHPERDMSECTKVTVPRARH
jgi:hypothetical protein